MEGPRDLSAKIVRRLEVAGQRPATPVAHLLNEGMLLGFEARAAIQECKHRPCVASLEILLVRRGHAGGLEGSVPGG